MVFNRFRRWFTGQSVGEVQQPAGNDNPALQLPEAVLYLRVPPPRPAGAQSAKPPASAPQKRPSVRNDTVPSKYAGETGKYHGELRRAGGQGDRHSVLETLSVSERRCLRRAGLSSWSAVLTLPSAELQRLRDGRSAGAAKTGRRAARLIRRTRWAVRFSGRFSDMTPRQALMLRAVHRGHRDSLALEQPGMLRRDLQRLAYSSAGSQLLESSDVPSVQLLNSWIGQARHAVESGWSRSGQSHSVPPTGIGNSRLATDCRDVAAPGT